MFKSKPSKQIPFVNKQNKCQFLHKLNPLNLFIFDNILFPFILQKSAKFLFNGHKMSICSQDIG